MNKSIADAYNGMVDYTYALSSISAIFSIFVYGFIGKLSRNPIHTIIKNKKVVPIINIMAVCMAIGARLLVSVFYSYAQKIQPLRESIEAAGEAVPEFHTLGQIMVALFAIVVLMPFFEEILFRGLFMGELIKSFRPLPTIIIQAAFFAAAHMVLFQSIFTFGVGVLLGIVYYKTQSLKTAVLFHGAFNLSAIIPQIDMSLKSAVVYGVSGIVLCAFSLAYIILYGKNK
ncbi:MAG: CPBP family intramembrane metalloprotease [Clostridia bacterium]|nr:CPBP family intramembrane metalloprotease [Clostridia bacterium]